MNQAPKSATTAGLLGIFLGTVGAHNWYLGDKKKGIIHVVLFGVGIVSIVVSVIMINMAVSTLSFASILSGATSTQAIIADILRWVGIALISGSEIWGFIEGIMILSKGDAGLAAEGYYVASMAQPYAQQPYGQPYQQGYQQPYSQPQPYPQQPMYQQPMGQPMYQQPMPGQPMPMQGQPMMDQQMPMQGQPMPEQNNNEEQNNATE